MHKHLQLLVLASFFMVAVTAMADSITIKDKAYTGVYIRESGARYYVQNPADGKSLSVSKDEVTPADVHISEDPQERQALLAAWKEKNPGADQAANKLAALRVRRPAVVKQPVEPAPDDSRYIPAKRQQQQQRQAIVNDDPAIVEKEEVKEDGVSKLVLKGTRQIDYEHEQQKVQQFLQEQAPVEEVVPVPQESDQSAAPAAPDANANQQLIQQQMMAAIYQQMQMQNQMMQQQAMNPYPYVNRNTAMVFHNGAVMNY